MRCSGLTCSSRTKGNSRLKLKGKLSIDKGSALVGHNSTIFFTALGIMRLLLTPMHNVVP